MTDLSTILSPERRREIRERAERPRYQLEDGTPVLTQVELDRAALLSYCDEADRECQRLRAALQSILDVPQTMSQLGQLLTIQDIAKAALNAKETP